MDRLLKVLYHVDPASFFEFLPKLVVDSEQVEESLEHNDLNLGVPIQCCHTDLSELNVQLVESSDLCRMILEPLNYIGDHEDRLVENLCVLAFKDGLKHLLDESVVLYDRLSILLRVGSDV